MGTEMYNHRKYIMLALNFCENLRILGIQWTANLLNYLFTN